MLAAMVKIHGIIPDSIAEEAEISAGDFLVAINGVKINDILDYKYVLGSEELEIEILTAGGESEIIEVYNGDFEDLGMVFEGLLMDKPRACRNKCMFCFIDQLPPKMRDSVYFKDDDYRLSLLQGNYVTLTNAEEADIQRIIDYRLPRINISVHATDTELRRRMLGNSKAVDICETMRRLADAGVRMHTQVVLCPDVNDGENLNRTIADLGELHPAVESVSVVPVGLTKFREGLHGLRAFGRDEAAGIIEQVGKWQKKFLKELGTRLVYLGDEFYVKAGVAIPDVLEYEEFHQIENGVGMIADFLESEMPLQFRDKIQQTAVTGVAFAPWLEKMVLDGTKVVAIENRFFGGGVTVAGLVTGRDIIEQLRGLDLGKRLLVPSVMLRADSDVFLDDVTIGDIERELKIKVEVI